MLYTGGRLLADRLPVRPDAAHMKKLGKVADRIDRADRVLTFDKATGVFHAGAIHEENQPSHLKVRDLDLCHTRCRQEYGNPCEHFCPANVYEMIDDPGGPAFTDGSAARRLQINHSNCVHCKTCDIMDPYQIITWTVPNDAGGPKYLGM